MRRRRRRRGGGGVETEEGRIGEVRGAGGSGRWSRETQQSTGSDSSEIRQS